MRSIAGGREAGISSQLERVSQESAPVATDGIDPQPGTVASRRSDRAALTAVRQALRIGDQLAQAFAVPCVVVDCDDTFDVVCVLEAERSIFASAWQALKDHGWDTNRLAAGPVVLRPGLAEPVRWLFGFRVHCPAGSVLIALLDTVPRDHTPHFARYVGLVRAVMAQWTSDADTKAIALSAVRAQVSQIAQLATRDERSCLATIAYDCEASALTASDDARALMGEEPLQSLGALAKWIGEPHSNALKALEKGERPTPNRLDVTRSSVGPDGQPVRVRLVGETIYHGGEAVYWIATVQDVAKDPGRIAPDAATPEVDAMTSTLGHGEFEGVMTRAMEIAQSLGTFVGLVMVDVDRFRSINIEYGHTAGDELIRFVARCLTSMVRATDSVIRLGGDDFAVVLSGATHPEGVTERAERIAAALQVSVNAGSIKVPLSCSLGVAIYPDDGVTADGLLRAAKQALETARAGRKRRKVMRYDQSEQIRQERHKALISRVRDGVAAQEFEPFFQPKVDLHTGKILGFEALLRWQHPSDGTLTPGAFYQALEDQDVGGLLSDVSLQGAFEAAGHWAMVGLPFVSVAVNLNAQQLERDDLLDQIEMLRRRTDISPSAIVFEVLESVLIRDKPVVYGNLLALSAAGYKVALDDFRTGFASLSHIREPFIREVKIDRSFVTNAANSEQDRQIVAAIVQIARKLKLNMVAEGIEDEETLRHLRSVGCTVGQGFVFAPALPRLQATEFVARQFRIEKLVDVVG